MLDKTTSNILTAVSVNSKDATNYVILKNEDIRPNLGKKNNKISDQTIGKGIQTLAEREYIKLKYSEEGTYCLIMLPKGKLFEEDKKKQKQLLKIENRRNLTFLARIAFISGFFAMIGAILGVLIANYIIRW